MYHIAIELSQIAHALFHIAIDHFQGVTLLFTLYPAINIGSLSFVLTSNFALGSIVQIQTFQFVYTASDLFFQSTNFHQFPTLEFT
jgi:hypothetical protein